MRDRPNPSPTPTQSGCGEIGNQGPEFSSPACPQSPVLARYGIKTLKPERQQTLFLSGGPMGKQNLGQEFPGKEPASVVASANDRYLTAEKFTR